MKKIIYSLVIASIVAFSFSSCTEEEVRPQENQLNGGGTINPDKI